MWPHSRGVCRILREWAEAYGISWGLSSKSAKCDLNLPHSTGQTIPDSRGAVINATSWWRVAVKSICKRCESREGKHWGYCLRSKYHRCVQTSYCSHSSNSFLINVGWDNILAYSTSGSVTKPLFPQLSQANTFRTLKCRFASPTLANGHLQQGFEAGLEQSALGQSPCKPRTSDSGLQPKTCHTWVEPSDSPNICFPSRKRDAASISVWAPSCMLLSKCEGLKTSAQKNSSSLLPKSLLISTTRQLKGKFILTRDKLLSTGDKDVCSIFAENWTKA